MAKDTKKQKVRYGKFVSEKSPETLAAAQKKRLLYMYASTLTLAALLFVPQEWAEKARDIAAVQTAYVLIVLSLIVVTVIASYGASRKCNLTKPISEKYKPRGGFEKGTFAFVEWKMYLHILLAVWEIALLIYGFGPWGLLGAALSAGGAALAVLSRRICFLTLKDELTFVPPEEDTTETAEDRETEEKDADTEQQEHDRQREQTDDKSEETMDKQDQTDEQNEERP